MTAALEDAIFEALGSFWWLTPREKLAKKLAGAISDPRNLIKITWRDGLPALEPGDEAEAVRLAFHNEKIAELNSQIIRLIHQNDLETKEKTKIKKTVGPSKPKRRAKT